MIIICNGMLRSGSTLQYNLAANLIETGATVTRVGFMGDFGKSKVRAKLAAMRDSDERFIVKTHEGPLPPGFYTDRVKVLFSYRDLRDIAASIRKKWGHPFTQILAQLDEMVRIEAAFDSVPNVLVQPYDRLFADLLAATGEIADFLGAGVDVADIDRVARDCRVGPNVSDKATRAGIVAAICNWIRPKKIDARSLLHSDHISASGGQDGDWVNQFSAEEICQLNARYGSWLDGHGYAIRCLDSEEYSSQ